MKTKQMFSQFKEEIFIKNKKHLPIHSLFWEVSVLNSNSNDLFVKSAYFHSNKKIAGRFYKPANNIFRLNELCHD